MTALAHRFSNTARAHGSAANASNSPAILTPGVSEIIIPSWEQASFELVLPMLAHLSNQAENRWLTWIGQATLSKQTAQRHAFAEDKLRMIQSRSDEQTLWMMWDALNNGTSAFVIGCFHNAASVQEKERKLLSGACENGFARALALKLPSN